MKCRHCYADLNIQFLDLGRSPPSNAFLSLENLKAFEKWYPLRVLVCDSCWLVQTEDFVDPAEMFAPEYAYLSSISSNYLDHAKDYVHKMATRFSLDQESLVAEVAANDGYLLQYVRDRGIPCYGIEPTESAANIACSKGIEIIRDFFGKKLANRLIKKGKKVDLAVANNVLAHVPNINDFVIGFADILKPKGVATFENPHLLKLIEERQFDTVYHEHFSYLSLTAVNTVFKKNGLTLFDVEELPVHGGSLRYYAQRSETGPYPISKNIEQILQKERYAGLEKSDSYKSFQNQAQIIKNEFLKFLRDQKKDGKLVAGYGAAAKGNTLLNFCGVKKDLVNFIVDKNQTKQGMYSPGSKIPILGEEVIAEKKPDVVIIFPWNIKAEIEEQLSYVREWGCKFVVAVPQLSTF